MIDISPSFHTQKTASYEVPTNGEKNQLTHTHTYTLSYTFTLLKHSLTLYTHSHAQYLLFILGAINLITPYQRNVS